MRNITATFTCTNCGKKQTKILPHPQIKESNYYEDWRYKFVNIKCISCDTLNSYTL